MSTSDKSTSNFRIDPARAERFLRDLANKYPVNELLAGVLKDRFPGHALIVKPAQRIRTLYPEMASPFADDLTMWAESLYWTQILLRRAWTAHDARHRNWYLYEMRKQYRDAVIQATLRTTKTEFVSEVPGPGANLLYTSKTLIDPPAMTPFEATADYFQSRVGDRAKYCAYAECSDPYFIAPHGKARKYCSEKCFHDGDAINKHESYLRKKAKKRTQ
jgi:hypothetical protein